MNNYYAKFIKVAPDIIVRHDTRIYFKTGEYNVNDGNCIGAVICKNPGSATSKMLNNWAPLNLDNDNALPTLKSLFEKAASDANIEFKTGDYIQVYNLFLVCSANLGKAMKLKDNYSGDCSMLYEKVKDYLPFYFFAWGTGLIREKEQFIKNNPLEKRHHFYLEKLENKNYKISVGYPDALAKVKHPQGMPHKDIQKYIGALLNERTRTFSDPTR